MTVYTHIYIYNIYIFQHAPFICLQLLRLNKETITCRTQNSSIIVLRPRLRLITADHLALDVLAGNPGCSCAHRCTLSHSDISLAPMSMAFPSEFLAVVQTIKYLQI